MSWKIETTDWRQEAAADNGNRFLIANGYMGIRGTLDEQGREQLAAVNLAGLYDQVGDGWREPLNAPNPIYTVLSDGAGELALPHREPLEHRQALDYRYGVMSRETTWETSSGTVTVRSERFVSMVQCHLIAVRYQVRVSAPMELTLEAGIDGDLWELYGPHYKRLAFSGAEDRVLCQAQVQNGTDQVVVGRRLRMGDPPQWTQSAEGSRKVVRYTFLVQPEGPLCLESVAAVYTTRDTCTPYHAVETALAEAGSYDALFEEHRAAWDAIWKRGDVVIEGDDEAQQAVRYSLYHLNSIAPRHCDGLSIPARGLSGQTYKGAVFWDSEIFMLDYFLYTQPEVARSMVHYRIDTLPGALEKARSYGWQGAFYAWESQEGGRDACSDYNVTDVFTGRPVRTYFKDKQVHISAAVARAVMLYTEVTGDCSLLAEGGARTVLECARFYYSLLVRRSTGSRWEIHDVIGPDEYHERVNNNAYTNRIAAETFRWAIQAAAALKANDTSAYWQFCEETDAKTILPELAMAVAKLYVPTPGEDGVIEQFDGYFKLEDVPLETVRARLLDPREYWGGANGVASHTQIIKQADVVTMLEMFHGDYAQDVLRANWDYYEPRTEHGSSLSACMYALLACRFGEADKAYPFFMKSAQADRLGGGKQWAGLVYIGGTHPAAQGGTWKVLAEGFAGLDCTGEAPVVCSCLPEGWKRLRFHFSCRGRWYLADLTQEAGNICSEHSGESCMKYDGIIFDLDGVICSTDHYHYLAWKALADSIGVPFDERKNDRLRGVSRMDSLEIVLEEYRGPTLSEKDKEALATQKNDLYRQYLQSMSPADLSDTVRTTLDALRAKGLKLAIGSSSKNTPLILERIDLSGFFDAVSDGNNITRSKPDPQVFVMAAEMLGLPVEKCLVVEDAEAGIQAACAGGFHSAGIGPAAQCGMATYSVKRFQDLMDICT